MPEFLTGPKRFFSLVGLSLATFLLVLDYTIANIAIPYIAGDLSVSASQGTYVITSFTVGNAIVLPISGWLTKRIGSVRLITLSTLLFVFFSWLCGFSFNFEMLIASRFLQGFVSGPLIPLSQSLIISTNPPEKKNAVLAFWSTIVVAAPVIGPLLGGWITYDYSWPWIFYINIPFGLLGAACIYFTLGKFESKKEKAPVDSLGFFLLAISVACLQVILDKGEQFNWFESKIIITLATISSISLLYFIAWEKFHKNPLVESSLFRIKSYVVSVIFMGAMYAMYFGSVVLIPLWLQLNMGYDAIWAGIAVAPIGIAPLLLSSYAAKIVNRFGKIIPLIFCFIFFAISCFYTAYFNTSVDLNHIWISRLLLGFGIVLFITPLFALSVQDIDNGDLPSATGFFHFIRAMSGGLGTSIFTTLWFRRSAFHHNRIGSALTPTSYETNGFFRDIARFQLEGDKEMALLNQSLNDQASMLALNDCFYLMGWIFLALILLLPFGRKKSKKEKKVHPSAFSIAHVAVPHTVHEVDNTSDKKP